MLLVLALAGLSWVQPTRKVATFFLIDASDSLGSSSLAQQTAWIETALGTKSPDDEWGVIVFGANSVVEQSLTARADVLPIRSVINGTQTHLADALTKALSLIPSDSTGRIVLFTDGKETIGDSLSVAQRAKALGVTVYALPMVYASPPDVRLHALTLPPRVSLDQPFDLTLEIDAEEATSATLLLSLNGQLLGETPLTLNAGRNRYTLPQRHSANGFLNFTAQVIVPNDSIEQNNRLSALTQVMGRAQVLVIMADDGESEPIVRALAQAGYDVTSVSPDRFTADNAELASMRAVVIANVPSTRLTPRQQVRLQSYVRDLGGGLIFVGGDKSYGVGGYAQTPLEETLPVTMTLKDDERLPQLTMAYLIDTSGSMEALADGTFTYLQLAQQSILLSLALLQPTDRLAVATFDNDGRWIAPFQTVGNGGELATIIASLRGGGGTDILAGLRLIETAIRQETSARKHLILLTDGGASSNLLVEKVRDLRETANVTTSVIAIGAEQPFFLEQMAQVGDGNYHAITDSSQIPRIFAQETVLASRSYIIQEPFTPIVRANHPILAGIADIPRLEGYVATTPKPTAQHLLTTDEPYQDPILSVWQYGLGRAVAFTSDATTRWGQAWQSWSDYGRFWGQVVAWSTTESATQSLETRFQRIGERVQVTIDARDERGSFLNGLALSASLITPEGNAQTLQFQQTNAGEYQATFTPITEGAYVLAVQGQGETGEGVSLREGWVNGYSSEYGDGAQSLTRAERLIETLTTLTGGQNLEGVDFSPVFAPPLQPRSEIVPLWEMFTLLALLLLPLDVAVRRLIITRSDVYRARAWLFPPRSVPSRVQLDVLEQAKERAKQRVSASSVGTIRPSAPPTIAQDVPRVEPSNDDSVVPPTKAPSDTVSALLKRKRGE